MIVVTPERALAVYRGNVENFAEAAPIALLVAADEGLHSAMLDLPDDVAEMVAPAMIRALEAIDVGPLTQALLSVEVEMMNTDRPFAGKRSGVAIYSAGVDEYRLMAPFEREQDGVTWFVEDFEVIVGPIVTQDPVIVALRWLVEQSR